jgi:serine/threonine protein phosphatase 1
VRSTSDTKTSRPKDERIAIGDVHGCSAALAALVRAIDPTALDALVFLGDYIDRGPDSRGVVEQVIALGKRCTVVPLLGKGGGIFQEGASRHSCSHFLQ